MNPIRRTALSLAAAAVCMSGAAAGAPTLALAAPAPAGAVMDIVAPPILVRAPVVPADSNGVPLERCGPDKDGTKVDTYDAVGGRHRWTCAWTNNLFGPDQWEWLEIMVM